MANVYNSQLDAYSTYHKLQELDSSSIANGPGLPALGHALSGSTGTAISNLALYPLDLVITRLQVQRSLRKSISTPEEGEYKGVLDAFEQIYFKEGGITAFYTGIIQDTGKSIADSFLFFLFYNYLRTNRLQKNGRNTTTLPVLDELTVGVLSGACSKFFTTPISNIVTRKQTSLMLSARSNTNTTEPTVKDIIQTIRSQKGIQGFWSGYSASLILTLNPSITFFLYEFFKRSFLPRDKRGDPGARITFLMAAISKAIASTITYPFSLAKARAQTSSSPPINPDVAEKVKEEVGSVVNGEEAKRVGKNVEGLAKRSTVFDSVLRIWREEGVGALYEGIWGEIFKGFLGHGLTMIVKEWVHKGIIQLYYLILKALNRYPSPAEVASQAGEKVKDIGEKVGEVASNGYVDVEKRVEGLFESGKEVAGQVVERAGMMVENGKSVAGVAVESAGAAIKNGKGAVGDMIDDLPIVGNNATEATKTADDLARKEAGHLLGNAQELLGDKIGGLKEDLKKGD